MLETICYDIASFPHFYVVEVNSDTMDTGSFTGVKHRTDHPPTPSSALLHQGGSCTPTSPLCLG